MSNEFVEKNNNAGLIIIIVILGLAVLGLGGYVVYDIFVTERVEEFKPQPQKEKVRELSATEAEEYMEKVRVYNKAFSDYYLTKDDGEISNKDALLFAMSTLEIEEKDVTVENVNNILITYFGKKHKFKLDDIHCGANDKVIYEYDEENNLYIKKEHLGHGATTGSGFITYSYYVSSNVKGNKVSFVVKNLYEETCGDVCGEKNIENIYYKDFDLKEIVLGDVDSDNNKSLNDELYDSVKDKLNNVTYNFIVEESGNFYLESVSIEK